jgi:hypothetical protein
MLGLPPPAARPIYVLLVGRFIEFFIITFNFYFASKRFPLLKIKALKFSKVNVTFKIYEN